MVSVSTCPHEGHVSLDSRITFVSSVAKMRTPSVCEFQPRSAVKQHHFKRHQADQSDQALSGQSVEVVYPRRAGFGARCSERRPGTHFTKRCVVDEWLLRPTAPQHWQGSSMSAMGRGLSQHWCFSVTKVLEIHDQRILDPSARNPLLPFRSRFAFR